MSGYRTVVFDCDSTLCGLEGIEELAADRRHEVTALTDAAMRGEVPLEEVYGRRLDLIRPSRQAVDDLVPLYIDALVDDAAATVAALRTAGVAIRIVSGGLLPAVLGLARHLALPDDAVAAVPVRFHEDGSWAGHDALHPAARAGGKAEIVRAWRAAPSPIPGPVLLVGDGATDLEARHEVDLFVAYAGVVARPAVLSVAPVVLRSRSLAPLVPLALGDEDPDHESVRDVFRKGTDLIADGAFEWR
ncbi:MAG: HAD-IB family phosphatase [Gemmatimonadetes bacterium]|nr:HAD-IB family phosphatase [Gemmatimonadota bacterium]